MTDPELAAASATLNRDPTARRAVVSATLTDGTVASRDVVPPDVSEVEVRADIVGDIDPRPWREQVRTLTYSLRSASRGGHGPEPGEVRWRRLVAAARHYDLVDLEADHDLVPEVLSRIPAPRRRISWHGAATSLAALGRRFDRIAATPARLYLLAPAVASCAQALVPMRLLTQLGRRDVTAFGTGPAGVWSRLVAPFLGAPIVFGRLRHADDSGVPTVVQLLDEYPFPALPRLDNVYGIVGRTANRSLSPLLHNSAYRALGLPHLFLPFQCEDLTVFWEQMVASGLPELGLSLQGLTVTAPLKRVALALADDASPRSRSALSANVMVCDGVGGWRADTTDGSAVLTALRDRAVPAAGKSVAVIGCGGAGRAAAAELIDAGARVTLVNRSGNRGRRAARLLGAPFVPLASFDPTGYQMVVNATPLRDTVPFTTGTLDATAAVLDFVYASQETALVSTARGAGLTTVDGWEMLAHEVRGQFQLMTGRRMPGWITERVRRLPAQGSAR